MEPKYTIFLLASLSMHSGKKHIYQHGLETPLSLLSTEIGNRKSKEEKKPSYWALNFRCEILVHISNFKIHVISFPVNNFFMNASKTMPINCCNSLQKLKIMQFTPKWS